MDEQSKHTETDTTQSDDDVFEAVIVVTGKVNGSVKELIDAWDITSLSFARALKDELRDSGVSFSVAAKLGERPPVLLIEKKDG